MMNDEEMSPTELCASGQLIILCESEIQTSALTINLKIHLDKTWSFWMKDQVLKLPVLGKMPKIELTPLI